MVVSSASIGPSLANQTDGYIYKLWSFLQQRVPTTSLGYYGSASTPYSDVEVSDSGTMNVATPTTIENETLDIIWRILEGKMAKYKNKKK